MSSNTRTLKVVVVGNASQAAKALKGLTGDLDRTGSKATVVGGRLSSTFAKVGKSAAAGLAVATVAAGAFVYKVGSSYEQSLNKISALRDETDMSLGQVAKSLEAQAGKFAKYGFSVGDAAAGVVELKKAGQSLDQSMKSLNGTLVLARAGELSVADASSLVANTLNTFKMGAGQAAHVANSLANAANASSADVSDLREALAMAGLAAKQAGLDIDETNAYLAILHNNGMKGSDAGTSLKTMMLRLTSGSNEVTKALKGIGVSVFNTDGSLRNMNQVVKDFLPALDKLSDEKRAQALYKIFGSDSIRSANAIFGEGSKKINEYMEAVRKKGTAEKFASAQTQGLSGAVQRFKALSISGADMLYRKVAPSLADMANKGMDAAAKLKAKVGPALRDAFSGGNVKGGGAEFSKVGNALKSFGASMMPTLSKIGSQIMGVLGPAIKSISEMFVNDLLPAFREFLPAVQPVAKFLLNILGGAVVGVLKGLVNVVKGVLNMLSGLFKLFTGLLTGDWGKAWEGLKQILKGALQAIWGAFQVWWNGGILNLFRKIPMALGGLWRGAWNGLKSIASAGMNALKALFMKILGIITSPFRQAFAATKNYVTTGWAFIRGKFSGGIGSLKAVMGRVIQVVTYPYRTAFNIARNVVSNGWSAVRSIFSKAVGNIKAVVGRIKEAILSPIRKVPGQVKNLAGDIVRGLANGIWALRDLVADKIKSIVDNIPKKIRKIMGIASPSKVTTQLGKWITEGLSKGISDSPTVEALLATVAALSAKIVKAFKKGKIGKRIKDEFLDDLKKRKNAAANLVRERLGLQSQLEKAEQAVAESQERLSTLRERQNSAVESSSGASRDYGRLANAFDTEGQANSVAAIIARFAKRLANIKKFRSNLMVLRSRGLSQSLLEQVAGEGPDNGGAIAAALVKGSAGQLANLSSIAASIENESMGLGTDIGSAYDADIRAAEADLAAKEAVAVTVNVQIAGNVTAEKELVKSLTKEIREALKADGKRNGK